MKRKKMLDLGNQALTTHFNTRY